MIKKYLVALARLALLVVTAAVYLVIDLAFSAAGLVLVPVAILFGHHLASPITGKLIFTAPSWLWVWGNDEEGYLPAWYAAANPTWGEWRRMYTWAAIRNSANNLRFLQPLSPKLIPAEVRSVVFPWGYLAWQGIYTRLELNFSGHWFGFGWRVHPEDAEGVEAGDWRLRGTGFGFRYIPAGF